MPKTRTKRVKSTRRFDWVYRGYEYDPAGDRSTSPPPSWSTNEMTIVTGVPTSEALVLYDSQQHMSQQMQLRSALGAFMTLPKAARSEGRQPLVKRVEGELLTRPSAWAVGNLILWAWAIMIAEQDPETGLILLPTTWSLLDAAAGLPFQDTSIARNERTILASGVHWRAFNSNSTSWTLKPSWSSERGRLLAPEQGLFLFLEASSRSVSYSNMVVCPRMRSLIADEA